MNKQTNKCYVIDPDAQKMSWSLQSFYFANSTFHCTTKYLQTISMNPEASAGNKLSKWISPDITQQRCGRECQTYVFLTGQTTSASAPAGIEREWLRRETFKGVWHIQNYENLLMAEHILFWLENVASWFGIRLCGFLMDHNLIWAGITSYVT